MLSPLSLEIYSSSSCCCTSGVPLTHTACEAGTGGGARSENMLDELHKGLGAGQGAGEQEEARDEDAGEELGHAEHQNTLSSFCHRL